MTSVQPLPSDISGPNTSTPDIADIEKRAERLAEKLAEARLSIGSRIFGQEQVIDHVLVTLLAGGHALLVGVPGLAKTRLVETLGTVMGLQEARVQFTPDLMPADILGSEVLDQSPDGARGFRFIPGPIFCQLLMADEINRASPRTQSALLQAMQEGRVTIAGQTHPLPRPFHVVATQNPLEQEGTYPLPEAQLDRFLMEIPVTYPDWDSERQMLLATTGLPEALPKAVLSPAELMDAQALVRSIPVGESVVEAILRLVRQGRPETTTLAAISHNVSWGPGPRAAQGLILAARARALADGRFAPSLDDVADLAPSILRHRMALSYGALADGVTMDHVIDALVGTLG